MNDPHSWLLVAILILAGFFLILILIRLVNQLPTSAEASRSVLVARGYLLLGRTKDAMEATRNAIRLDCDDAEAHSLLAHLLIESGEPEEAVSHFQRAVQLEPWNDMHSRDLEMLHNQISNIK